MVEKGKKFVITIDKNLYEMLESYSEGIGRRKSTVIEESLREHLLFKPQEKRSKPSGRAVGKGSTPRNPDDWVFNTNLVTENTLRHSSRAPFPNYYQSE